MIHPCYLCSVLMGSGSHVTRIYLLLFFMEIQEIFSKVVVNLFICVVCTCPEETCGILASEFTRESIPMDGQRGCIGWTKSLLRACEP